MAVIAVDTNQRAALNLRFNSQDEDETRNILADIRRTVLERMEYFGFHPDGVVVTTEVGP